MRFKDSVLVSALYISNFLFIFVSKLLDLNIFAKLYDQRKLIKILINLFQKESSLNQQIHSMRFRFKKKYNNNLTTWYISFSYSVKSPKAKETGS